MYFVIELAYNAPNFVTDDNDEDNNGTEITECIDDLSAQTICESYQICCNYNCCQREEKYTDPDAEPGNREWKTRITWTCDDDCENKPDSGIGPGSFLGSIGK